MSAPAPRMTRDPPWLARVLIFVALFYLALNLLLPLAVMFAEAFSRGVPAFVAAIADPDAVAALKLTLLVAAIAVPVNAIVGLAASWAIAKHDFAGRALIVTLIDLPFSVSPVVAGLAHVLLYGAAGWFGPWLMAHGVQVIFAVPALVLVTMFTTFPFVARELIPLMEAQGREAEEAALSLGASGWRTFWHVTLPDVRWGLAYGVLLCNARAMGEYGAVSIVSGQIRGLTNTLPLHVELLYNEYSFAAAFAVATLLAALALVTLAAQALLSRRHGDDIVGLLP